MHDALTEPWIHIPIASVTGTAFRSFALSLPEATESPHFERTSFRVNKKIFATMTKDGSEAMVRVAPRQKLYGLLREYPDVFFSYGGFTERMGALGVKLAKVDATLLHELLTESWQRANTKRSRARRSR
jgi:hypothetical protein